MAKNVIHIIFFIYRIWNTKWLETLHIYTEFSRKLFQQAYTVIIILIRRTFVQQIVPVASADVDLL